MHSHFVSRLTPVALAAALALAGLDVAAQPAPNTLPVLSSTVAPINATVTTPAAATMAITQTQSSSNRAVIEWNSFSIGSAAKVNITQPNAQSVLVNRVTGSAVAGPAASEIYGAMSANGRVFLVNPAGIVFGGSAQVNVGSLVATTLDLSSNTTANNYESLLKGDAIELVQTQSGFGSSLQVLSADDPRVPQIQVGDGGSIVLVSRDGVTQSGVLSAPKGLINITTAASTSVLPVGDSGFVQLALTRPIEQGYGGDILFDAGSQTLASGGSIVVGGQPKETGTRNNTISIAGTLSTDSTSGDGGSISIDAGVNGSITAQNTGVITSSSTAATGKGGSIDIKGGYITLNPADIINTLAGAPPRERPLATSAGLLVQAEGSAGGGTITVGDANTRSLYIGSSAVLSADATASGNGGSIAVRALYENTTVPEPFPRSDFGVAEIYGQLFARGGTQGGNGGAIETSGVALTTTLNDTNLGVLLQGSIDARARVAGALAGQWTLDPFNVTIGNNAPVAVNGSFNPTGPGATVRAADISAALNAGTNVDISTAAGGAGSDAGNITIESGVAITRDTGTSPTTLTLRANDSIFMDGASIDASKAGPVNLNFFSDLDGNGTGGIVISNSQIATGGGKLTMSGGLDPSTGFAQGVTGQHVGVQISDTSIDTRGNVVAGRGDVVIRGECAACPSLPGTYLQNTSFNVGNLSIDGRASHLAGVDLSGTNSITTDSGLIAIRGVATRVDATAASLIGVDVGSLNVQLGTGSFTLAGRGDEANITSASNGAIGVRIRDLHVSAAANSTGTITLAGQATGNSTGAGISAASSTLIISSDATTAGNAATGANVVIGGLSDASGAAINLTSGSSGLNVATTGAVNLRPLGVSATGAITEQTGAAISVAAPSAAASSPNSFTVSSDVLRPGSIQTSGISAGKGIIIGSAEHVGAIDVGVGALDKGNHGALSLTLQNEGAGSQGISFDGSQTVGNLALLTAGDVTQTGPLAVSGSLVIRGGAQSNILLTYFDPEVSQGNQFGRVAFDPPATLSLTTIGDLVIDSATAQGFSATNGFSPVAITASQGGTQAFLQAIDGNVLINQSIGMADPGASLLSIDTNQSIIFANGATLSTSAAGKWRLFANSVVNMPSVAHASRYGCLSSDTTTCTISGVAIPTTGNVFLSATQPTVTVTATPQTVLQGGAIPALTYTTAGLVNGDTAAIALGGALATNATSSSAPGTYAITQGTLTSPSGYNVVFQGANLTLGIGNLDLLGVNRQMLQSRFAIENSSDVYGRNLAQPFICTAASVVRGSLGDDAQTDPLSSEWGKVRNQPQLSGCLNVTDGGSCSAF